MAIIEERIDDTLWIPKQKSFKMASTDDKTAGPVYVIDCDF